MSLVAAHPMLVEARARAALMRERLAELVSLESPTADVPRLRACAQLLAGWGEAVLGRRAHLVVRDGMPHLLWPAPAPQVLLLGHFDTVWPAGTIDDWPYLEEAGRASGPGVCDMKAGIVVALAALDCCGDTSRVALLLTADEESGSPTSRALIEEQARLAGSVLVCEPATETGALKAARRGGSHYQVTVRGKAAHAGVEPHRGVNATVAAARLVLALRGLAGEGTSVTPTVLTSGTRGNVVPELAVLHVDVRAWTSAELVRVDQRIRSLRPGVRGATVEVSGGVNRYPLPASASAALLARARTAAAELGLPEPDGASVPGASDANFAAAAGVPTLDGLGAVGGGSHARREYVELASLADRAALLAALVRQLLARPEPPAGHSGAEYAR